MSFKLKEILKENACSIFLPDLGVVKISSINFELVDNKNIYCIEDYDGRLLPILEINAPFTNKDLYKVKPGKIHDHLYGSRYYMQNECVKVSLNNIKGNLYFTIGDGLYHSKTKYLVKNILLSEAIFLKYWISDNPDEKLKLQNINNVKVGDKYYVEQNGICEVTKILVQTNKTYDKEIEVKNNNKTKYISVTNSELFVLPENEIADEQFMDFLDSYKFDIDISYISSTNLLGIYWSNIDNATLYKLQIYNLHNCAKDCSQRYRLLNEIIFNRNSCMFCTHDLYPKDFLFVLIAEDRNGNVIAKSQAFNNEYKIYMQRKNEVITTRWY